jgi:hypothetical protein
MSIRAREDGGLTDDLVRLENQVLALRSEDDLVSLGQVPQEPSL